MVKPRVTPATCAAASTSALRVAPPPASAPPSRSRRRRRPGPARRSSAGSTGTPPCRPARRCRRGRAASPSGRAACRRRRGSSSCGRRPRAGAGGSRGCAPRPAPAQAAARIRDYHLRQLKACGHSWSYRDADGTLLGQKVTPLDRVGIYVPGGKAAYPSSVLMNAMPAQVAGVGEIIMVVPTPRGGKKTRWCWRRRTWPVSRG